MQNVDIILWVSVAVLVLFVSIWAQQRGAAARRRAERARRAAERESLGGNSYFLPLPPAQEAVEIANPVEIESLLAGESETVAQHARRQLEASTDIPMMGGLDDLSLMVPPAAVVSAPVSTPASWPAFPPVRVGVTPLPLAESAPVALGAAAATTAGLVPPTRATLPVRPAAADNTIQIPVRELVLAWFEARGYRASAAPGDAHSVELVLRHSTEAGRAYAFVVERGVLTVERAAILHAQAREMGLRRILVAAEGGSEDELAAQLQRHGFRIFDENAIRAELGRIDIRVAAKIIAVARGRALAWRSAPTPPPQRRAELAPSR